MRYAVSVKKNFFLIVLTLFKKEIKTKKLKMDILINCKKHFQTKWRLLSESVSDFCKKNITKLFKKLKKCLEIQILCNNYLQI